MTNFINMKTRVQDEFAHVLSFRRQIVTINLVLKYEDTNYRVFFTFGDFFKCKMTDHFANHCPIEVDTPHTPVTKSVTTLKNVAGKRQLGDDSSPEAEILYLNSTPKSHNHSV